MKLQRRLLRVLAVTALIVTSVSASAFEDAYREGLEALDAGRPVEAREAFASALEQATIAADRGLLLDRLGDALAASGDWRAARDSYQRSLAAWHQHPDPKPLESVLPLADLANMDRRLGQYTRSGELYAQAYESAVELAGRDHPEIAVMLNQRAQLSQELGDWPTAVTHYAQAIAIWERLGLSRESAAAYPLHNLGLLEVRQGNLRSGRKKIEEARAIWQATRPASHPVFAGSFAALGEAAAKEGNLDDTRRWFESALRQATRALGPGHIKIGLLLARYSEALRLGGRKKESRDLRRRAEVILSNHGGWRQAAGTVDIEALERSLR